LYRQNKREEQSERFRTAGFCYELTEIGNHRCPLEGLQPPSWPRHPCFSNGLIFNTSSWAIHRNCSVTATKYRPMGEGQRVADFLFKMMVNSMIT